MKNDDKIRGDIGMVFLDHGFLFDVGFVRGRLSRQGGCMGGYIKGYLALGAVYVAICLVFFSLCGKLTF